MATVELRYDPKDAAWFAANPTLVLKAGEPAYSSVTGLFKLGDGVTQLQNLSFLPVAGGGENLAQTLALGNNTGANDIDVDTGQQITFDSGAGNLGVVYNILASPARLDFFNLTSGSYVFSLTDTGYFALYTKDINASKMLLTDASKNVKSSTLAEGDIVTLTGAQALSNKTGNISQWTNDSAYITASSTNTLTNKRRTRRLVTTTQSATPTINTDNTDVSNITGLAQAITSFTTNLSGTPVDGDLLEIRITDNGTARAITWGASFAATTIALPTTTVISTMLRVGFEWDGSVWRCIATA